MLPLVAVFGVALLVSVLVSGLAARTVLSTSLVFLGAGVLVGPGALGLVDVSVDSPVVETLADLALVTVLFTDGMRLGLRDLAHAGRAPVRALGIGMPLTILAIGGLVGWLTPLSWPAAFLVGAVLSPTDPVFASAIVGRVEVPYKLRRLLNVESGLNDGLALPIVVILLAAMDGTDPHPLQVAGELALGIVIGVALPLVAALLVRLPRLGATPQLQPLGPLAVGIITYAVCELTSANQYLAAFLGGATVATIAPRAKEAFEALGEQLAELGKFAALLVFGALLTPTLLGDLGWGGWAVAVLALLVVRPLSFVVAQVGVPIPRRELWTAAWFGPKGFASVVYGLLVLASGDPEAQRAFALIAVCIAVSIVAHSSTDVPVSRLFDVEEEAGVPASDDERDGERDGEVRERD
ncbi:sodium:proton antiporter [Klenkia sp. PcliD-1-E]|uniref:cation:proton antiporter n=1 Tax=Klenkia sp. PcliD-1-E TaxID=2954492 RepID=UPI002097123D|nr:cation:proton antiporter [Klenkia sp. PcliD-1-E]MCO7220795.1 cation:proton antiporter [Klenkia sp. PcliD-1-E]